MDEILRKGAQWAIENAHGEQDDLMFMESNGRLGNADPRSVSFNAKKRGMDQLGTIGAGNHFVEIDKVSVIYDHCHGAGRRLSRRAAKQQIEAVKLKSELESHGIHILAGSLKGIAEEAPIAYKDVDLVVETVHIAGIAKKVARLEPLAVIKG